MGVRAVFSNQFKISEFLKPCIALDKQYGAILMFFLADFKTNHHLL